MALIPEGSLEPNCGAPLKLRGSHTDDCSLKDLQLSSGQHRTRPVALERGWKDGLVDVKTLDNRGSGGLHRP